MIRDLTLRDGQQSQLATRMTQAQVDKVLHHFPDANFHAMEVWGGAVPDSVMRFLNEDPWERLAKIKKVIGNTSKLTALSRGRNLFGYNPYPEKVIEGFNRNAIEVGIDIMRIFDALNDIPNMAPTIDIVGKNGGQVDAAVCYTVDSHFTLKEKIAAFFQGKKLPQNLFDDEYFIDKAVQLDQFGPDIITLKDMAGLLDPARASTLLKKIKDKIKAPLNLHTHCTPGFGLASTVMGMISGCDIIDTCILNFAGGPAAPPFELIYFFANKMGIDTGVNLEAVGEINVKLAEIRKELGQFDKTKMLPRPFNIGKDTLPKEIEKHFDTGVEMIEKKNFNGLLEEVYKIEKYFNLPAPNVAVRLAQIPGGMYTNMVDQLEVMKLSHLFDEVLETIPSVRLKAGCPPLVTPTSQIVGSQAVNGVVNSAKEIPFYKNATSQYVNLVKGSYGKTPFPVEEEFRFELAGTRQETAFDPSSYKKPDNPVLPEYGNVTLAKDEKEMLLLELFPAVAKKYLSGKRKDAFLQEVEEQDRIEQGKIESLYQAVSGNYLGI